LNYLSITDLLHNCRLVSKQWTSISSALCRQRNLRLDVMVGTDEISDGIFDVFLNLNELPWSSCILYLASTKTSLDPTILKFLSVFGIHILELQLAHGNCRILPDLLLSTPNLKRLDIQIPFYSQQNPDSSISYGSYGHLCQLKSLKMHLEPENVDFLQHVLTSSGCPLEYIKVKLEYCSSTDVESTLRVASLIADAGIPLSLSLLFDLSEHNVFNTMIQKKILIRKLHVELNDCDERVADADFFGPLENFLSSCPHLDKLRFSCSNMYSLGEFPLPARLRIPRLPSLKCLTIDCADMHDREIENFQVPSPAKGPID